MARGDFAGGKSVCRSNLNHQTATRCGLAAAWVVILLIHFSSAERTESIAKTVTPPSQQEIMVLQEQKQMMAKLIETFDQPAGEPPKPYVPRPKSECRTESVMV
jgi:hypothetical protein